MLTSEPSNCPVERTQSASDTPKVDLTRNEHLLLNWLLPDGGQYGECHGVTLDGLIAKGLVCVGGRESGFNNSFIAKGSDIMHRVVSITDAGRRALLGGSQ